MVRTEKLTLSLFHRGTTACCKNASESTLGRGKAYNFREHGFLRSAFHVLFKVFVNQAAYRLRPVLQFLFNMVTHRLQNVVSSSKQSPFDLRRQAVRERNPHIIPFSGARTGMVSRSRFLAMLLRDLPAATTLGTRRQRDEHGPAHHL